MLNLSLSPAHVEARGENSRLIVEAQVLQPATDEPYNWEAPEFVFADRDGTLHLLKLAQVAPGTYRAETDLAHSGTYRGVLRYRQGNEQVEQAAAFAAHYPDEWRPDWTGAGGQNLARWARETGGETIQLEALPQPAVPAAPAIEIERVLSPLLWALIISWPVEIALRCRWLPWPTRAGTVAEAILFGLGRYLRPFQRVLWQVSIAEAILFGLGPAPFLSQATRQKSFQSLRRFCLGWD